MCSVYSGFITVCMNDWNILKCLFCWIYYPFIYNHARVREKYYGQHNRLQPRSPVANNNAAAARAGGQAQPIRGGNNPQAQYGIIPPAPQPQNMGGQVYYRPAQQPAQPVYNQAPVNYAAQQQPSPQYQQAAASPVYQQPLYQPSYQASPPPANIAPAQPRFQSQEELLAQYRPPQQQQPYQPPAQQFSPYHQPEPAQYQPASAAQVQFHVEPGHQVEGQPNPPAEEYHQAQPQAGMPHAPGGVASVGAPAAIPVAQPIAQPAGGGQRQPQEQKSAVAMARESALNAASQVKNFLKK
jgi:hypothetical protein